MYDEKAEESPTETDEQAEQSRQTKTEWHQLLGKLFELLLSALGVTVFTGPPVMSEPPRADIILLRQEGRYWTPMQLRFLPDGIRTTVVCHVLIEFKFTQSLTIASLRQIIGDDHFYA